MAAWVPKPPRPRKKPRPRVTATVTETHLAWLAEIRPALLSRATELLRQDDVNAAEDLVQDACLRFLENPPQVTTATSFKHWLRVVMKHMSIDQHRYWASRSGDESRLAVPGPREWQLEPPDDE